MPYTVALQRDELVVLMNTLNEVLHGPEAIEEWEFQARTGGTRQQARELLRRLAELENDRAVDVNAQLGDGHPGRRSIG